MARLAIPCRKQKSEIVMKTIDKSDSVGPPLFWAYLEAEASCRTVLMKVEVARVWVRSRL
jgi:hypothetical protein